MANGVDTLAKEHLGIHRCEYEIAPFDTALTLEIKAAVYEEGGVEPTSLIAADQAWYVEIEWRLVGALTHHLCGEWCPQLHIECYGPGDELTIPSDPARIPFDPCREEPYKVRIRVAPNTIDPGECGSVCCLAVTLSSFDLCGKPGHVFAFCKGPCIMFHRTTHENG